MKKDTRTMDGKMEHVNNGNAAAYYPVEMQFSDKAGTGVRLSRYAGRLAGSVKGQR